VHLLKGAEGTKKIFKRREGGFYPEALPPTGLARLVEHSQR
jgi:hypothetical protein